MQCSLIIFNMINVATSVTVRYRPVAVPDFYKVVGNERQPLEDIKPKAKPIYDPAPFPDYSSEKQTTCRPVYGALNDETICDTILPTTSSSSSNTPASEILDQSAKPPPTKAEPLRSGAGQRIESFLYSDAPLRYGYSKRIPNKYKLIQEIQGTTSTFPPFDVPPKDEDNLDDSKQQEPKCSGLAACRAQKWSV